MSELHRRSDTEKSKEGAKTGFFQRGRELESVYDNHRYNDEERAVLAGYESLDYLPPHSTAYKHWLRRQPRRLDWDRWVMMGLIGFSVGFVGFLLHQAIDAISDYKWDKASQYIEDENYEFAWGFVLLFSMALVIVSSAIIVLCRPSAAASGLPELIGFLNGTVVRHIFNIKTLVAKFFSCLAAVASGLPVGPEGPMIHMGSLIGAGLSQMRSKTLGFHLPVFGRFRNSEDRRNFISAGAGAGIASAFGAPVGGLLFSMEEVSSFWNQKLTWQIFFCCMISTFTTDLFNSAFSGFKYDGNFGLFKTSKYILFEVVRGIPVNILVFFPTIIIGVLGGVFGALFTFLNVKIARLRRLLLSKVASPFAKVMMKMGEPLLIIVIYVSVTVFLPKAFFCTPFECGYPKSDYSPRCLTDSLDPLHTEPTVYHYACPHGVKKREFAINHSLSVAECCSNSSQLCYSFSNGSFSEVATLMFTTGEDAIKHLFSRQTHNEFGLGSLAAVLVIYFFLSCWCAGTHIASGLVVPMLFIGALYGRIVGIIMVKAFGIYSLTEEDQYWVWIDPGAFALIGAASFFGGVSRLTVSLTVIMVELTNDVQFLLPIMVTIMVAKWSGDFITHPIYHALLELKCIPFLDAEPVIIRKDHDRSSSGVVNLELYSAENAMSFPVKVVHVHESVATIAELLSTTSHGGYPVVRQIENGTDVFAGHISRHTLQILLTHNDLFKSQGLLLSEEPEIVPIDLRQVVFSDGIVCLSRDTLQSYVDEPRYQTLFVDLGPYLNQSAPCVQVNFSLHRTYILFRTLGLRHLVVVDAMNRVAGVISRKDLMGFSLEERLHTYEEEQREREEEKSGICSHGNTSSVEMGEMG